MLPVIAVVIAGFCVAASFARLMFALTPTVLDLGALEAALRGNAGRLRLPALKTAVDRVTQQHEVPLWEHEILHASETAPPGRIALMNEQLQELDWKVQRWVRVPRVCASIATSSGLLLATLALREGLLISEDVPAELRDVAMHQALTHAIDVAAIGLAGAAFCIAIQLRARKAVKDRSQAADKLVERLEALAAQ